MNEFLSHFGELVSDPAHLAFEVFTTLVIEGLLLGLLWPLVKRHFHRDIRQEHQRIEAEHGLVHPYVQREGYIEQRYLDPHEVLPYDYEKSGI